VAFEKRHVVCVNKAVSLIVGVAGSGILGHLLSRVTTTDITVEYWQKSPVKAVNPRKKP
jgi:hypothetical protein